MLNILRYLLVSTPRPHAAPALYSHHKLCSVHSSISRARLPRVLNALNVARLPYPITRTPSQLKKWVSEGFSTEHDTRSTWRPYKGFPRRTLQGRSSDIPCRKALSVEGSPRCHPLASIVHICAAGYKAAYSSRSCEEVTGNDFILHDAIRYDVMRKVCLHQITAPFRSVSSNTRDVHLGLIYGDLPTDVLLVPCSLGLIGTIQL